MSLIASARIALGAFGLGLLFLLLSTVLAKFGLFTFFMHSGLFLGFLFYAALTNLAIYVYYPANNYSIAVRSLCLGLGLSLSVLVATSSLSFSLLGWYAAALCVFHWSEYFVTAVSNPSKLSLESFLLDHSREYHIAVAFSFIEFFIEWLLFPSIKQLGLISVVGLCIVVTGEILRKMAMLTAMTNFNHYVQHVKQDGHQLVTNGIYGLFRHPSYVGWFYWSIGTQVMLCNPFCCVAYALVSWKFFNGRIIEEEIALIHFFGEDYVEYKKNVGTGLPFIEGYKMNL